VHDVFLKFTGGSGLLFNFNWWRFTPAQTGIKGTGVKSRENGNLINVTIVAGKTRTLRLDFSQPVPHGNMSICLFDVTGRLATTLFTGQLAINSIAFNVDRSTLRTGAYLMRVSSGASTIIARNVLINE
jgi:hypothetical protein